MNRRPDHRGAPAARRPPRAAHPARHPRNRPLHHAQRTAHRAHRPDHRHRRHAAKTTRPPWPVEALDRQVTDLAAQLAPDLGGYHPDPAPAWWKLAAADRQEPIARLQAWVEQVYRPGYGHLAATFGPCWPSHDLCLYGLDILSGLWSVLYLQPDRTPRLLSAQAEYQARILPALAAQLMTETSTLRPPRTAPGPGQRRSAP